MYNFNPGDKVTDNHFGATWIVEGISLDRESMKLRKDDLGGISLTVTKGSVGWEFRKADEIPIVDKTPDEISPAPKPKNGMKLTEGSHIDVARNPDTPYSFEMFVDIKDPDGGVRPIAVVRPCYVGRDKKDAPEYEGQLYQWEGNCNLVVKGRFEIVLAINESDLDFPVRVITNMGPSSYIELREAPERGMIPAGLQDELCYIPLYDGYGISAVENPNESEIYIGIKRGISWWQNLLRIGVDADAHHINCDVFWELMRTYMVATKTVPIAPPTNE